MDPITALSTILSLVVAFKEQRKDEKDASVDEFRAWLADNRQAVVIDLLISNAATTVGIKALLHESLAEIVSRLEQLRLQISVQPDHPDGSLVQVEPGYVETISLGINNKFAGTAVDLGDLATRCAVYAIEGKRVEFQVELQETVLEVPPEDPLILPRYQKARVERAKQLKMRLQILTSQSVFEWWNYFLSRREDWGLVIQALLFRADLDFIGIVAGQKIDVWRTEEPRLSAAIFLNEQELAEALQHLGFQSIGDLRFGSHWRAAVDLPLDLIVRHVIPSILVQMEQNESPAVGDVLNLAAWHIGEG